MTLTLIKIQIVQWIGKSVPIDIPDINETRSAHENQSLSFTVRGPASILYYYNFPDITELLVMFVV